MPLKQTMNENSLAGIIAALRHEFKQFVDTRLAMLTSELKTKLAAWKISLHVSFYC